jgi:hypothetical protein
VNGDTHGYSGLICGVLALVIGRRVAATQQMADSDGIRTLFRRD